MRNLTRGLTFIGLLTTGGVASAADLPSGEGLARLVGREP